MKACEICGDNIHENRLEFFPAVTTCLDCSDDVTKPIKGYMIYSHKTAGEVVMTSGAENIRILEREYHRGR